jgi:hypothetical protein
MRRCGEVIDHHRRAGFREQHGRIARALAAAADGRDRVWLSVRS